jgi:hypothetical protein
MDNILKCCREDKHVGIHINKNLKPGCFADNQVIVTKTEDELQHAVNNLQISAPEFCMSLSV